MTEQKGVSRNKGITHHFNLDSHTIGCLNSVRDICNASGSGHSSSVIIRRALRLYREHMERLKDSPRYHTEAVELQRAAKGVL